MQDLKICVYAMCKDESKFVDRFMDSVSDADYVVVLDTGSTDDTVEKLRNRGATVEIKEIKPWRFDVARNESMKLIPDDADVCLCVDLDEVFEEGWADTIRKHWIKGKTEKAKYLYTWNHDAEGEPLIQIWYEKMHDNSGNWHWTMPVHEALTFKLDRKPHLTSISGEELHLHHYPDPTKSRGQYLDLMRMGVEENPECYLQNYYLGRELTFYYRWQEAIDVLEKTVKLPNAPAHAANQAAAYGLIGKAYESLKELAQAESNYVQALYWVMGKVREPYINLANFYYRQHRWYAVIDVCERTLEVPYVPTYWYEDTNNYGYVPHDLLAIAYWNVGLKDKGKYHAEKAVEYRPDIARLQHNLTWFESGESSGHSND